MRTRGNSPNIYVIGFVCVVIFIVLIFIIYKILSAVALNYAAKNRKKLLSADEKLSKKLIKEGDFIKKCYKTYSMAIEAYGLDKTIQCSSSVVSNASINQVKYAIKYSNIGGGTKDLEVLEFMKDYLHRYGVFLSGMGELGTMVRNQLPPIYRLFVSKKRLPYVVCDVDYLLSKMDVLPQLCFSYTSPAGRSGREYTIDIDEHMLSSLVSEISKTITKKGHKQAQRAAMTNDLREAIKKRDNYTCCKCGNSVYKEPNLLLEVDHIIPVSKGGKTEADNLQTLCWRCNRLKGNKEE
ncbi:HNH endonuclease [Candidatus Saccharibacteria bacterium]|nr:HNH endonuclease [Candidatus Saccharibacteria bacterium]